MPEVTKVLVVHPELGIINACRTRLCGLDVVGATSIDEAQTAIEEHQLSGAIIHGDIEDRGVGLLFAAMMNEGYFPRFKGTVVGISNSVGQFDEFEGLGIPSSNNHGHACFQLGHLLES